MLGAIKYKGFIPWDNDIDIWMLHPDYNRFRKNDKTNPLNENIQYLDCREERTFLFLKALPKRTRLIENFWVTENLGLYVDIFPLDRLPAEEVRLLDRAERYNSLFAFINYKSNTDSNRKVKF